MTQLPFSCFVAAIFARLQPSNVIGQEQTILIGSLGPIAKLLYVYIDPSSKYISIGLIYSEYDVEIIYEH